LMHLYLNSNYEVPLSRSPGTEMSYSNFSFVLLGEIVRRVSGLSIDEFSRTRVFEPLGMESTYFVVPDSVKSRVVRRPSSSPYALFNEEWRMDLPLTAGGLYSTAHDLATFGQMFLNGGIHRGSGILSRPTIITMTRNQIPGIGTDVFGFQPEAGFGYGWKIQGDGKWRRFPGTLLSPQAVSHTGTGGAFLWVDPTYDVVGVYLSAAIEKTDDGMTNSASELFTNAVAAAIDD
jgi:CubicO group peptidase (beta-lactamase class C family)